MEVKAVLEKVGFTPSEAEIYLALLELGSARAGKIIEKSGLQNSVVHFCLRKLITKGLVSYVVSGGIRTYTAKSPKNIIRMIDEQKGDLEAALPELLRRHEGAVEDRWVEVFEGIKGRNVMFDELIGNVSPYSEYLFFTANKEGHNEEMQNYFRKYDLKRRGRKLEVKGIAPKKLASLFKGRGIKMRFTNRPIPKSISICEDKIAFLEWADKPFGFLIKSKQLSDDMRAFFYGIWNEIGKE